MTCSYINDYMTAIRSGTIPASIELFKAMDYIERTLDNDDVTIETEKVDKAIELIERYFEMKLLDWELFILALVHCYYQSTDTVVFDEFFIMMGRGNGKNGFISGLSWYLTTQYHGINGYNVDIVANSEEQAGTSFNDVHEMLERTWAKSKYFFYKSKSLIRNVKTGSYIMFNTSNARSKDSKRSACLIFDEVHEYEDYKLINVFTSGFGKRKHSRTFYITTNGHVRDGVLDDMLQNARDVLNGVVDGAGLLPLIYKMDKKEEADNPDLWIKANPSINHFRTLRNEVEKVSRKMKTRANLQLDFYTKRMNLPETDPELKVTEWENLLAASRGLPDLTGKKCIACLDYARLIDFAAAGLWIPVGDMRYWITHTWVCKNSADLPRIRYPIDQAERDGLLTIVDDVEISPELPVNWIAEKMQDYQIDLVAMDNHRLALVAKYLKEIGFSAKKDEGNNIRLVRPSNQVMVVPVIESYFNKHLIAWGEDHTLMRWYANNVKLVRTTARAKERGNYEYGKIEGKSRKTDGFMAMIAGACFESEIGDNIMPDIPDVGVYTY